MSQLRISRPGKPTELVLLEPARARPVGYGGAAIGHYISTFVVHQRPVPALASEKTLLLSESLLRGEALLEKPRQRTYRARP